MFLHFVPLLPATSLRFSLLRVTADLTNTNTRGACSGAEKQTGFFFAENHSCSCMSRSIAFDCLPCFAWVHDRFMHACRRFSGSAAFSSYYYLFTRLLAYLACSFARLSRLSDGLVHAQLTCIACMNERLASFRADVCFAYGR